MAQHITRVWAALLIAAVSPVAAQDAAPPAASTPAAPAPFVAVDFAVPVRVEEPGFTLVPLGPDVVDLDFAAYMSSIEHLQRTFTRSTGWPREGITAEEAMADMLNEEARFKARTSFAYAVLTPDGTRERGCVYVYPSPVPGHDAMIRLWVTKAEFDAGFDAALYAWAKVWAQDVWGFENPAFPGRAIAWDDWDQVVKASKQS